MLRILSSYYYKEAGHLFCVSRGILVLCILATRVISLLKVLYTWGRVSIISDGSCRTCYRVVCLFGHESIILGKYRYMLYVLVLAMQPRMLMTVDENLRPLSVPVRVDQAVDVVGQAGRPKNTFYSCLASSW